MKTLALVQGSPEWASARRNCFCASEAAAMLGLSSKVKRNELLYMKKTGSDQAFSEWVQKNLLDKGHEIEALTRPIAEGLIGETLYPVVGVDDIDGLPMLASFDGIVMAEDISWENKMRNAELVEAISIGMLPDDYWPQAEHQLLVSGASSVLFTASDGTPENTVHLMYCSIPGRRRQIIAGWKQFERDLNDYVPAEILVDPVAAPIESLPSVSVQVQGSLTVVSNLSVFGQRLKLFVEGINKKPETDQDFADCEAAIKVLEKAETALNAAEAAALAQVECIDEMRRMKTLYYDLSRNTRLMVEKLVKAEKENKRVKILQTAKTLFTAHITGLNITLGKPYMPEIAADFAGVMKGLKSITSLQNAVDTELARAKITANEVAQHIQTNLNSLRDLAKDHAFLFSDTSHLVLKANDDLIALIKNRISEHKAAEAKKEEDLREQIRAEEVARIERDRIARESQEAADKLAAEQKPVVAQPVATSDAAWPFPRPATKQTAQPAAQPVIAPTSKPDLRLGQITERLGFSVTADFLRALGFEPVAKMQSAQLYHESSFPLICAALVKHIHSVCEMQEA